MKDPFTIWKASFPKANLPDSIHHVCQAIWATLYSNTMEKAEKHNFRTMLIY